MSQHAILQTEEPKEALLIRGYTFNAASYGFNLGSMDRTQAYKVSVFGSVFMNDLLIRSGIPGAASFRFAFGAKRYRHGDLAACSPSVSEEALRSGKTYEEADAKILSLFLSDDLSDAGIKMPCLYEVPLVNVADVTERYEEDGESKLKIKDDDKPFYFVVNMASLHLSEVPNKQLPDDWKAMLVRRQYSFFLDVSGNRLAVSNTKSAYFGLPPNSKALRMPLLKTQIIPEKCRSPAAGKKSTPKGKQVKPAKPVKEKKTDETAQAAEDQAAWKPRLREFIQNPSETTYKSLVGCGEAWKTFYAARPKEGAFKMSKYAAKRMRKPFVGVENAVDGSILVEVITKKWAEEFPRLMIILKWATLTRWEQGKVYFKEETPQEKAAGLEEPTVMTELD